ADQADATRNGRTIQKLLTISAPSAINWRVVRARSSGLGCILSASVGSDRREKPDDSHGQYRRPAQRRLKAALDDRRGRGRPDLHDAGPVVYRVGSQDPSRSYAVMAFAASLVLSPRSFWQTTPCASTMKVMMPLDP